MTTPHPSGQKGTARRFAPQKSNLVKKEAPYQAPTAQEREDDRQQRLAKRIPIKEPPKQILKREAPPLKELKETKPIEGMELKGAKTAVIDGKPVVISNPQIDEPKRPRTEIKIAPKKTNQSSISNLSYGNITKKSSSNK